MYVIEKIIYTQRKEHRRVMQIGVPKLYPALAHSCAQWQEPEGPWGGKQTGTRRQLLSRLSVWALLLEGSTLHLYVHICICSHWQTFSLIRERNEIKSSMLFASECWVRLFVLFCVSDSVCICVLYVPVPAGGTHSTGPRDMELWYPYLHGATRFGNCLSLSSITVLKGKRTQSEGQYF